MPASRVAVGLVQMNMSERPADNMSRACKFVEQAARRGARIVCLPELFRTRYFPQRPRRNGRLLSESIPGESTGVFSVLAKRHRIVIVAPLYERDHQGKLFNSAAVLDADGTLLPTYRKIHLPHDPLFWERDYFKPGDVYRVYRTRYATFAVLICYDQWFPEAARQVVLAGADLIFYPTAIGTIRGYRSPDGDWHNAWETVQRGHAIANGVHVAAVNRVGVEGKLKFWGQSFVCDAFGQLVKRADSRREEVVIARLDLSRNKRIRDGWGFLKHLRPETYRAYR